MAAEGVPTEISGLILQARRECPRSSKVLLRQVNRVLDHRIREKLFLGTSARLEGGLLNEIGSNVAPAHIRVSTILFCAERSCHGKGEARLGLHDASDLPALGQPPRHERNGSPFVERNSVNEIHHESVREVKRGKRLLATPAEGIVLE